MFEGMKAVEMIEKGERIEVIVKKTDRDGWEVEEKRDGIRYEGRTYIEGRDLGGWPILWEA